MIKIEIFGERYLDGVVDVILPIQQLEFNIPITLRAQPGLLDIPGFYQKGTGNFWVALQADEVVGTIALLDIGNGQGALRKMFVKKAIRDYPPGVANRLLAPCWPGKRNTISRPSIWAPPPSLKPRTDFMKDTGLTKSRKAICPLLFP